MTSEVFRAAVEDVFLLRAGLAFEIEVNQSTLAVKLPGGVRRILMKTDAELLRPVISGTFPSDLDATALELDAWARARGVIDVEARPAEVRLLELAISQISRLRALCALVAERMEPILEFSTLRPSRHSMVQTQILRLRAEAVGDHDAGYRTVPEGTLSTCFDLYFPSPCLNPAPGSAADPLEQAVCRTSAAAVVVGGGSLACGTLTEPSGDQASCARCSNALSNLGADFMNSVTHRVLIPLPRRR